jgi:hypothetical protein
MKPPEKKIPTAKYNKNIIITMIIKTIKIFILNIRHNFMRISIFFILELLGNWTEKRDSVVILLLLKKWFMKHKFSVLYIGVRTLIMTAKYLYQLSNNKRIQYKLYFRQART